MNENIEDKELIEEVANAASGDAVLAPVIDPVTPTKPWVTILLLAALALIWGSSFILMKKGLVIFTPVEMGNLRIFSAFMFLAPVALTRLREVKARHWKFLIIAGLMGSYLPAFLFAAAGAHLSSAISGSLNALSPLFTLLVGYFFFSSKVSKIGFIGIMIGLFGALALSLSRAAGSPLHLDLWALPVVLATLFYAINLNLIKKNLKDVNSLTISALSLTIVGVIAGIFLFGFTAFPQKLANPPDGFWFSFFCIVALGVFGTAIALVLFNRLLKFSSAIVASSVTYLIPIVSVAWGVLDGERIMSYHYIGLALIIGGVFLVNKK